MCCIRRYFKISKDWETWNVLKPTMICNTIWKGNVWLTPPPPPPSSHFYVYQVAFHPCVLQFLELLLTSFIQDGKEHPSRTVLENIVQHFQTLFDVPSVSGVFPRMNDIYTKLGEVHNVLNTLRNLLGLGKSIHVNLQWWNRGRFRTKRR